MIGLFGRGKPDHPMADAREAKRLLDELPPRDQVKALEELVHWHESVAATPDFRPEARVERLLLIDAAAQERVKKVTLEYLAPGRLSRFQENRLWTAAHGYWRQASVAMAQAVDLFLQGDKGAERARALLPQLLAAALRALAQQIKWAYLRYGPNDPVVWGTLNRVYGFAEAQGMAAAQSAPRAEFLRGLMLSASAPECLLPAQLEITDKLLALYAPLLEMAAAGGEDLPFWTDVQRSMVPLRASRMLQPGPGVRYFGAGRALDLRVANQELLDQRPMHRDVHVLRDGRGHAETAVRAIVRRQVRPAATERNTKRASTDDQAIPPGLARLATTRKPSVSSTVAGSGRFPATR